VTVLILAFLIGVVAGLRALTPLAAVSWAARLGWLPLQGTWLAFLGFAVTPYIFTVPFVVRIVSGAVCGAALGRPSLSSIGGLVAGVLGAVAGTLGGFEFRSRLVKAIGGRDLPIALLEDAIAIVAVLITVSS
jgi:uncharacterized membrane protein